MARNGKRSAAQNRAIHAQNNGYRISHRKHQGTGFSTERTTTVATFPTKADAASQAKEMNKYNKGINARVVKK